MAYVVYNVKTTAIVRSKPFEDAIFKTEAAAKACKTRLVKKNDYAEDQIAIAEINKYRAEIEQQVKRVNLMSGKEYYESVNTPNYCSPSSEAYWSN